MKKIFLFAFLMISLNAFAQLVSDENAMYDRMDRLERDVTLLQRRVYRPSEQTKKVYEYVPAATENVGPLENLYMRIDQMEQQISFLTGQVEELSHELEKAKKELKKTNTDINFRFSELEKIKTTPTASVAKTDKVPDKKVDKKANETEKKSSKNVKPAQTEADKKDTKQIYDAAYKLVEDKKYAEAQIALEDFIEKYPNDPLAGTAQYWLGETFYVRGLYELAAVAFAKGFKSYKDSSKGADSLFKLGMTMEKLNKKKEACTAFKNVKKEYPKASESLITKAQTEMKNLGCEK